jgi:hypothetical protein
MLLLLPEALYGHIFFLRYIWAIEPEFWFYGIYSVRLRIYLHKPPTSLVTASFVFALLFRY